LLKITFLSPVKIMKCRLDPFGTTQSICMESAYTIQSAHPLCASGMIHLWTMCFCNSDFELWTLNCNES